MKLPLVMHASCEDRCLRWLSSLPASTSSDENAPHTGDTHHSPCDDHAPSPCDDNKVSSPHDSAVATLRPTLKRRCSISPDMDDTEQTPRPVKSKRRISHNLGPDSESRSDASSASSKRSRPSSSSPVKQQNRLYAQWQMEERDFTTRSISDLPQEIAWLVDEMQRCRDEVGIIPASLKHELYARAADELKRKWSREEIWFTESEDQIPIMREVEGIVRHARRCHRRRAYEAGWNSHVHGPLLLLASMLSRYSTRVSTDNITNARVMRRLLPSCPSVRGKMVDFAVYLEPDAALHKAFRHLASEDDGTKYWNHTDSDPVATTPLVVGIETKREGEGGTQAQLQLSLWSSTHLLRLAELRQRPLRPQDKSIYLPQLACSGPQWSFYLARGDYDDEGSLIGTSMYSDLPLGDVSTYTGAFKVIASLLVIMHWSQTVYRPWFEDWTPPTPMTSNQDLPP